jgi:hypothetical protein
VLEVVRDQSKSIRDKERENSKCNTLDTGFLIQAVLYNFAIDNPNEENYTGNEMALKTLQT